MIFAKNFEIKYEKEIIGTSDAWWTSHLSQGNQWTMVLYCRLSDFKRQAIALLVPWDLDSIFCVQLKDHVVPSHLCNLWLMLIYILYAFLYYYIRCFFRRRKLFDKSIFIILISSKVFWFSICCILLSNHLMLYTAQ